MRGTVAASPGESHVLDLDGGLRIFGGPGRYVQGAGAVDSLGSLAAELGASAVVIIDAAMVPILGERLLASFAAVGTVAQVIPVNDEVTHANIERRIAEVDVSAGVPLVVGAGGGKSLDLARAVSWRLRAPFVTVPTIASNDSPAAMAIAVYDDDHHMVEVIQTGRNPEIVLVDTRVIAAAPARFFSAGIGDAIAKKFEADACRDAGGLSQHGTRPLRLAGAIADECYRTLREFAPQAVRAAASHQVDEAFENTVEATILMSGLAFENGGLSIAHSLMRGLVVIRNVRSALHGEHVAYGLMVQRALEGADDAELLDLAAFLEAVELPASLGALGLTDPTQAELEELVERTLGSPHTHKTLAQVDRESLLAAISRVERLAIIQLS
jgi:glycerol dehydrogenase